MHVSTYVHTHLLMYLCLSRYIYFKNDQFLPIPPILIQHFRVLLSLLSIFINTFNREKLVLHFQYIHLPLSVINLQPCQQFPVSAISLAANSPVSHVSVIGTAVLLCSSVRSSSLRLTDLQWDCCPCAGKGRETKGIAVILKKNISQYYL